MRRIIVLSALSFLLFTAGKASAQAPLTLRYRHFLFTVQPIAAWKTTVPVWTYRGQPFTPPASLLVDGDAVPPLPPGVSVTLGSCWDHGAIRDAIAAHIAPALHRDAGNVVIKGTGTGKVTFDGIGLTGRDVDLDRAADLVAAALEQGVTDVFLPVTETQPEITIENPALRAQGITEVVTVGESNFSNSPPNRRHNIAVGLSKFNGHIIPQGTIFSFDTTLGRVDDTTGYRKELVIKGDRTIPDYGGGLCQVSTTAYRGVWEYGFPILLRRNHSYTVSHYAPQGTDATVFPPYVDMRFLNDSSGALLIQTYAKGDLAYFIFYGTKDDRKSAIVGPYTWDPKPPPPDRTEYSTELQPGEIKKMNERVPGIKTLWYRFTERNGREKAEPVYSFYEARPLFTVIGVEKLRFGTGSGAEMPTMFLEE